MIRPYYILLICVLLAALGWLLRNQPVCRGIIRFTAKWFLVLAGVVAGAAFADWTLFQNPRPAFCVFLQAPFIWFCSYVDRLHIFPAESLFSLVFVIPLWFVYWMCLGALIGFLLQLPIFLFWKWRLHKSRIAQ
jgi:hypothetical protein